MEAMRESWTDDRMDDLNGKVDALRVETRTDFAAVRGEMKGEFAAVRGEMKAEFAAVRTEMREGFEQIEKRFDRIDVRFEKIDERFERSEARSEERFEAMMDHLYSMQRQMIQVYAGLFAGLFLAVAGLIVTRL